MSVPAWRDRREDVLAPMLTALVKRAKRVVQDDQNALAKPQIDHVLLARNLLREGWRGDRHCAADEQRRGHQA